MSSERKSDPLFFQQEKLFCLILTLSFVVNHLHPQNQHKINEEEKSESTNQSQEKTSEVAGLLKTQYAGMAGLHKNCHLDSHHRHIPEMQRVKNIF